MVARGTTFDGAKCPDVKSKYCGPCNVADGRHPRDVLLSTHYCDCRKPIQAKSLVPSRTRDILRFH